MNEVEKLREIKRIADTAAKKIADSMAAMFGRGVVMRISAVNMITIENIPKFIGISKEEIVVSSYISFNGFLSGSVLCVLSIENAREIADILLAEMGESQRDARLILTEMEQSSIMELGNIITSSFIDTWSNKLSFEVSHDPPTFACDYMSEIIDTLLENSSGVGDFGFMFDSLLSVTEHDVDLEVLVLPDLSSMQKIFDSVAFTRLEASSGV